MRDKLYFEETRLPNGITVYYHPREVDFADMRIIVPVGSSHTKAGIINGSAHFLEHIVCESSKNSSEPNEFAIWLELLGGIFGASTGPYTTVFGAKAPGPIVQETWDRLLNQVFRPKFRHSDVHRNQSVIKSERKRNRWAPGTSELGHYMFTHWINEQFMPLERVVGNDDELDQMTPEYLAQVHDETYFNPDIKVLLGGTIDVQGVCNELQKIQTRPHALQAKLGKVRWKNREFHCKSFKDVGRYEYKIGAFTTDHISWMDKIAIDFIGNYLTNETHGVLYNWLRCNKGWMYELDFYSSAILGYMWWNFSIPCDSMEQVDSVRGELYNQITSGLRDKEKVNNEVNRIRNHQCFWYQKISEVLNFAEGEIVEGYSIKSMKDVNAAYDRCNDSAYLMSIYEKYFAPEHVGEFCAVPES
jgi:predicted Zn-dependent peptidase